MKIPNFSNLLQVGKSFLLANRPEMLLGVAVAATAGAVVLAAQGGYKSGKQVAEANAERAAEGAEPMNKPEIVMATWQNYVPAAGVCITALASTAGLHIVHVKEKKQLVAAGLAAVEEAKKSYQEYVKEIEESVKEHTQPKTREKIENSVMEKNAARNGGVAKVWDNDGAIIQKYLIRDASSGRDMWSNQAEIKEAVAELNLNLASGDVAVNRFYEHLGIKGIEDGGEDRGWNEGEAVTIKWSTDRREDGQPLVVFRLDPPAAEGYDKRR